MKTRSMEDAVRHVGKVKTHCMNDVIRHERRVKTRCMEGGDAKTIP